MPNLVDLKTSLIVTADPLNGRISIDPAKVQTLANSIASTGLLNPITVRPAGDRFELIAGRHRLLAFIKLGRPSIPAIIRDDDDQQAAVARLAENAIRSNLSPVEEATQLAALVALDTDGVDGVAEKVGRNVNWILDRLEILDYPDSLIEHVHARTISLAAAKRLTKIPGYETRLAAIQHAAAHGCSARTAALWLQDANATQPGPEPLSENSQGNDKQRVTTSTAIDCFCCREPKLLHLTKTVWICDECLSSLGKPPDAGPTATTLPPPPTG